MNTLTTYAPFAEAGFEDLFRGFFRPVRAVQTASAVAIKIDVRETAEGYSVHAEVPGARKDDLHVTIEGNQVTIAAEVKRESEPREGERVLRTERFYGSYYRSFALPVELDEATSQAKFENGVLELTLAKKQPVAGRRLTIQ